MERDEGSARRLAALGVGLVLAAAGASEAGAWSAAAGGRSSLLGELHVTSSDEPQALLAADVPLRGQAACLGVGTSRAHGPAGEVNGYEFGLTWSGSDLWRPQTLDFHDDPGTNDAYYRSVSDARVFDALERGVQELAWSARRNGPAAAELTVERSELALLCAKTELPWRDEGELPARRPAAVGGFTGPDAEVAAFGHYERLIDLTFSAARELQCLAVASGSSLNPSHGHVDQGYRLLLSRAGEGEPLPVVQIEHDDTPGLRDTASVPVTAVRFFPDVAPGPQTFTWWGIQEGAGTDVMTLAEPTLAVACARERLGPVPFRGRAAAGGAHSDGEVEVTSDSAQELVRLDFALKRRAHCAAFASAFARNPGGGTLDNVYHFRLNHPSGAGSWDMLLEFDDNAGVDDVGFLPIAHTFVFDLERGDQTLRFEALKDAAAVADLTVASPSLAVFCAKKGL